MAAICCLTSHGSTFIKMSPAQAKKLRARPFGIDGSGFDLTELFPNETRGVPGMATAPRWYLAET